MFFLIFCVFVVIFLVDIYYVFIDGFEYFLGIGSRYWGFYVIEVGCRGRGRFYYILFVFDCEFNILYIFCMYLVYVFCVWLNLL